MGICIAACLLATCLAIASASHHRACAGCHGQVVNVRPDAKAPTTMKCAACHKKG